MHDYRGTPLKVGDKVRICPTELINFNIPKEKGNEIFIIREITSHENSESGILNFLYKNGHDSGGWFGRRFIKVEYNLSPLEKEIDELQSLGYRYK